jgi:ribosomal protein S18 acetylase RimI-like enzyme
MTREPLQPTPFRGDPDVDALHAFFQPERQFAGDTLWSFGTSLKSAYVNSFEFLNHPPVVQLWRDAEGEVQAVSRIVLATGEWFYLAAPGFRRPEVALPIIEQADSAMQLLSGQPSWRTVAYQSDPGGARLLGDAGYASDGCDEVYMTRSLDGLVPALPDPPGCTVRNLVADDPAEVFERCDAQTDAFLEGQPRAEVAAWMTRTMPHQLGYGRPTRHPGVVAIDGSGRVLAFADLFLDHENGIGEFEPVGTRKQLHRRGLAKAVLTRGLELMQRAGMRQAVVRTGTDNAAAIAAYSSVGFETTDHLLRYRKERLGQLATRP